VAVLDALAICVVVLGVQLPVIVMHDGLKHRVCTERGLELGRVESKGRPESDASASWQDVNRRPPKRHRSPNGQTLSNKRYVSAPPRLLISHSSSPDLGLPDTRAVHISVVAPAEDHSKVQVEEGIGGVSRATVTRPGLPGTILNSSATSFADTTALRRSTQAALHDTRIIVPRLAPGEWRTWTGGRLVSFAPIAPCPARAAVPSCGRAAEGHGSGSVIPDVCLYEHFRSTSIPSFPERRRPHARPAAECRRAVRA
jgi:hypothetical protein